jgi:hypothetical protein
MVIRRIILLGLIGAISSVGTVVSANIVFTKLGKYHRTKFSSRNENNTEPLGKKYGKLWLINFTIALSMTGLVFIYTQTPTGSEIVVSIETLTALWVASLIMTFTLRMVSLSRWTSKKLFERALSFGMSFIISVFFLSSFGVSNYVIKYGFTLSEIGGINIDGGDWSIFILFVIFGPLISIVFSEFSLFVTGVDKDKIDEYDRKEPNEAN